MFPFTIDGAVTRDAGRSVSPQTIIDVLQSDLKRVRASHIWDRESGLDFEVNWFRWWTTDFNLLASVSRGAIDVAVDGTAVSVRYKLWVRLQLVICPPIILVLVLFSSRVNIAAILIALAICVGPYIILKVRFHSFVKRALRDLGIESPITRAAAPAPRQSVVIRRGRGRWFGGGV